MSKVWLLDLLTTHRLTDWKQSGFQFYSLPNGGYSWNKKILRVFFLSAKITIFFINNWKHFISQHKTFFNILTILNQTVWKVSNRPASVCKTNTIHSQVRLLSILYRITPRPNIELSLSRLRSANSGRPFKPHFILPHGLANAVFMKVIDCLSLLFVNLADDDAFSYRQYDW